MCVGMGTMPASARRRKERATDIEVNAKATRRAKASLAENPAGLDGTAVEKGTWKGNSKDYGGECWTCGEKSHHANECTNQKLDMEIGIVAKEMNNERVWAIAHMYAEEDGWKISRCRRAWKRDKIAKAQVNCIGCDVNPKTVVVKIAG